MYYISKLHRQQLTVKYQQATQRAIKEYLTCNIIQWVTFHKFYQNISNIAMQVQRTALTTCNNSMDSPTSHVCSHSVSSHTLFVDIRMGQNWSLCTCHYVIYPSSNKMYRNYCELPLSTQGTIDKKDILRGELKLTLEVTWLLIQRHQTVARTCSQWTRTCLPA